MTDGVPQPVLPVRVLFVCTANISRSPYAARRAAQLVSARAVGVTSAGIPGVPGRAMDPVMAAELIARGGDVTGQVSRCLTGELAVQADVILTFEFAQHMRILDAWPEAAGKVFGLHQFAEALDRLDSRDADGSVVDAARSLGVPNSMTWDVSDPYGRGRGAARRCANTIDAALSRVLPRLAASP